VSPTKSARYPVCRTGTAGRSARSRAGTDHWDDVVCQRMSTGSYGRSPLRSTTQNGPRQLLLLRPGWLRQQHERSCQLTLGLGRQWPPKPSLTGPGARRSRSNSPPSSTSTSARPRGTQGHLRRGRTYRRHPLFRRGRRPVRRAFGGLGFPGPLSQCRGELPAPAHGVTRRCRFPHEQLQKQH